MNELDSTTKTEKKLKFRRQRHTASLENHSILNERRIKTINKMNSKQCDGDDVAQHDTERRQAVVRWFKMNMVYQAVTVMNVYRILFWLSNRTHGISCTRAPVAPNADVAHGTALYSTYRTGYSTGHSFHSSGIDIYQIPKHTAGHVPPHHHSTNVHHMERAGQYYPTALLQLHIYNHLK